MKRILALDGGGIRGMLSLQVLKRLEELFSEQRSDEDLVLADVFDFFAGTSTGAIIATGLAWGMRVSDLESMYLEHGPAMFARALWWQRWWSKYRAESIADFFREFFSEDDGSPAMLGTRKLRRMLLVVMRNASTGAPWPVTSNAAARYNDPSLADCNLNIPLWQILRASTAAPGYFPPQEVRIGERTDLFVDGGITPYNNPALIAFLTATLPGYQVNWRESREDLHVISVGTGSVRARLPNKVAAKIHMLDQISHAVPALIGSAMMEQDIICRVLGDCVHGPPLDSEIGDLMEPTLLDPARQLFTYVRYDIALDASDQRQLTHAQTRLDNLALMPLLQQIGREYAAEHVQPVHLSPRMKPI